MWLKMLKHTSLLEVGCNLYKLLILADASSYNMSSPYYVGEGEAAKRPLPLYGASATAMPPLGGDEHGPCALLCCDRRTCSTERII